MYKINKGFFIIAHNEVAFFVLFFLQIYFKIDQLH